MVSLHSYKDLTKTIRYCTFPPSIPDHTPAPQSPHQPPRGSRFDWVFSSFWGLSQRHNFLFSFSLPLFLILWVSWLSPAFLSKVWWLIHHVSDHNGFSPFVLTFFPLWFRTCLLGQCSFWTWMALSLSFCLSQFLNYFVRETKNLKNGSQFLLPHFYQQCCLRKDSLMSDQ